MAANPRPKRGTAKRAQAKRAKARRERQFGADTGFRDWLIRHVCVGCYHGLWRSAMWIADIRLMSRQPSDRPTQVAHLVTRGAGHGVVTARVTKCGKPKGTPCVIPLCAYCHALQEGRTDAVSGAWGIDLWAVAALLAAKWEAQ